MSNTDNGHRMVGWWSGISWFDTWACWTRFSGRFFAREGRRDNASEGVGRGGRGI